MTNAQDTKRNASAGAMFTLSIAIAEDGVEQPPMARASESIATAAAAGADGKFQVVAHAGA